MVQFRIAPWAAAGTLILAVPSRDGLVVAADSRSTVAGIHCDNAVKIVLPARPERVVATVTGQGTFLVPPGNIAISDLCMYVRRGPRLLDIQGVVKRYLEEKNIDLNVLEIMDLAQRCLNAVRDFQTTWPDALHSFAGHELFSVVLAGYDPKERLSVIRSFVVAVLADLKPDIARTVDWRIAQDDAPEYFGFGETDYMNRQVFGGPGRGFLSETFIRFLTLKSVKDVDPDIAVEVATNLIEATAKTTGIIPAPTGIGGPIDVVLLGKESQTRQLQWKCCE
jgi:hypothetical protein